MQPNATKCNQMQPNATKCNQMQPMQPNATNATKWNQGPGAPNRGAPPLPAAAPTLPSARFGGKHPGKIQSRKNNKKKKPPKPC